MLCVRHLRPSFASFFSADNTQILSIFVWVFFFLFLSSFPLYFRSFSFRRSVFSGILVGVEETQEVACEHGANWMIRGMGLELHHHNNAE